MDIYEGNPWPFRVVLVTTLFVLCGVAACVDKNHREEVAEKEAIEQDRVDYPYAVIQLKDRYLLVDTANYEYIMRGKEETITLMDLEGNTIITDRSFLTPVGKYASYEEAQAAMGIDTAEVTEENSNGFTF